MRQRYMVVVFSVLPLLAHAEIYKAVDADGHVTYSSAPIKGGKKLNLEPLPTMAPPNSSSSRARASGTPADFPRVNGETQKGRDEMRQKILQDELDVEQKLLDEAQKNQKDGEENPEVFMGKDGKTYRNVAKYEEKIKALNDEVTLHQNNVEALKTELSKLK